MVRSGVSLVSNFTPLCRAIRTGCLNALAYKFAMVLHAVPEILAAFGRCLRHSKSGVQRLRNGFSHIRSATVSAEIGSAGCTATGTKNSFNRCQDGIVRGFMA